MWSGSIWLRIGICGGFCEQGNNPSCSIEAKNFLTITATVRRSLLRGEDKMYIQNVCLNAAARNSEKEIGGNFKVVVRRICCEIGRGWNWLRTGLC